jgi:integrase/recombinase XerD
MLTIYRRHRKDCEHRSGGKAPREEQGRRYRRCRCPIWVDGSLRGREIRKTLGTRDWERATDIIREWEATGEFGSGAGGQAVTITRACEDFLADAKARALKPKTVYKYSLLFRHLTAFAEREGFRFLKELDTPALRAFRVTWKDSNLAALKKLERLRSFLKFARENGWIIDNPAARISNPKVIMRPTLPFTREQMLAIIKAAAENIDKAQPHGKQNARRLRSLILLLRYTGLRIGDAVSCSVARLTQGKVRLYTQKTGTHVHCPLPDFVVKELEATPKMSERYWFWTGNGKLQTGVADWQGRLHDLFEDAGIENGHAHRFRDTYAVELLLAGVPIERVSILLGHTSVRVTERHYSPWVRERQEQAEADVRRTWAQDPVALLETKGTPEGHA